MANKRNVFFFDIDNCLYPKSINVQQMMSDLIDRYFMTHLSLSQTDANQLHLKYYKDYGLAIEGLVRHHKVVPLEYNREVDDALPLDAIITHNEQLRQLLQSFDTTKVKLWLFTNAYVTHGMRVVKLLGVDDLFEGITYCDYGAPQFICKPHAEMYQKAMNDAGVDDPRQCYFVDDSTLNCAGARAMGWRTVLLLEPEEAKPAVDSTDYQITNLEELQSIFPFLFQHRKP